METTLLDGKEVLTEAEYRAEAERMLKGIAEKTNIFELNTYMQDNCEILSELPLEMAEEVHRADRQKVNTLTAL